MTSEDDAVSMKSIDVQALHPCVMRVILKLESADCNSMNPCASKGYPSVCSVEFRVFECQIA